MNEVLLEAQSLSMHFGGVIAVDNISITLQRKNFRCIIGPNGAGKSTLFNMIAGTLRPTSGTIRYEGQNIIGLPLYGYARIGIARKFQVPSMFPSLVVQDNLEVAARSSQPKSERSDRIEHLLEALGLADSYNINAGELSHGQKQWLEIGMALMPEPKLLLLDEPTAGMTLEETDKTAELLFGLRDELTILAIEHDMRFVRALDCHTSVLHRGQIIADGTYKELQENRMVRDVYLGKR